MKNKNAVIIFAKLPEAGKVKTRLAATIGSHKALTLYTLFAEKIFEELTGLSDSDCYLFYADAGNEDKIKQWTDDRFIYRVQSNTDLGTRMYKAFTEVLSRDYENAVIIGTDVPDLTAAVIKEAFDALDGNDIVVGPADDGGYYLLGMKKPYKELFTGIEWSTSEVLSKTLAKAKGIGLTTNKLKMLYDIDTEAELNTWLETSRDDNPLSKKAKLILGREG